MNKVVLIGRLTKDLETRYTTGAKPIAVTKGSLAVNRRFKKDGEPDADFINITFFGKTAEVASKYLQKGSQVAVTGRLQISSYDNKEGKKTYYTEVIVEEMDFVGSKKTEQPEKPEPDANGFTTVTQEDDVLPF